MHNVQLFLETFDPIQARRYAALRGNALDIAAYAIKRHLRACSKAAVPVDHGAVREIIDDAGKGLNIAAEMEADTPKDEYFTRSSLLAEAGIASFVRRVTY